MRQLFIPYYGERPACVDVKGHVFIILSRAAGILEPQLDTIGADHLRPIKCNDLAQEEETLDQLARSVNGAVVIASQQVEIPDLLVQLEAELPWVQ